MAPEIRSDSLTDEPKTDTALLENPSAAIIPSAGETRESPPTAMPPTPPPEKIAETGMTAAHRSLPWGSIVKVINLANGKSVEVRINDRGPYGQGRIIDVSRAAARVLGMVASGVTLVRVELLSPFETPDDLVLQNRRQD